MAGTLTIELHALHTYQRRFQTDAVGAVLSGSHHYVISRGIRVVIESYRLRGSKIKIKFRVGGSSFRSTTFIEVPGLDEFEVGAHGRYWVARGRTGQVIVHGSAWALASMCSSLASTFFTQKSRQVRFDLIRNQEVLYIGKAYGHLDQDGMPSRSSLDRLEEHKTLQKIYEDNEGSEHDIFVTPLLVDGGHWTNDDYIDDDEPGPDLIEIFSKIHGVGGEANRVALAEEALIAYFKPKYNKQLKYWENNPTVASRAIHLSGLRVLSVIFGAWGGLGDFYSESVALPSRFHEACWVVGLNETEQPPYSSRRQFEQIRRSSIDSIELATIHSDRFMLMFGPGVPA